MQMEFVELPETHFKKQENWVSEMTINFYFDFLRRTCWAAFDQEHICFWKVFQLLMKLKKLPKKQSIFSDDLFSLTSRGQNNLKPL